MFLLPSAFPLQLLRNSCGHPFWTYHVLPQAWMLLITQIFSVTVTTDVESVFSFLDSFLTFFSTSLAPM